MASSADNFQAHGKRLALLGGSFNPPHIAHLRVAEEAYLQLEVERVVFVPAAQNPLKPESSFATAQQRLDMTRLAVQGVAHYIVDSTEVEAGGLSYTVETLRRYYAQGVGKLFFLVGADAALSLPRWREIECYRDLCTLAIYNRPGSPDFSQGLPGMLEPLDLRWQYLSVPQLEISSTEIRKCIKAGEPFEDKVPGSVALYIRQNGIGRNDSSQL